MYKCKVCGRRFRLLAKNRYEVVRIPTPPKGLWMLDSKPMEEKVYFNAFDCPHCGCQNILGVVEKNTVIDTPQESEVLDKIRTEIEQMNNLDYVEPVTVDEVLQIVDKYIAKRSNE